VTENTAHPDEYVGIVVNDQGATLPPDARLHVTIRTRDEEHFEEMVTYLAALELPGLSAIQASPESTPLTPYVYRNSHEPFMFISVEAPPLAPEREPVDPRVALVEEVAARVLGA
jgi:hypothetical protein